jgi:hypothetical protein
MYKDPSYLLGAGVQPTPQKDNPAAKSQDCLQMMQTNGAARIRLVSCYGFDIRNNKTPVNNIERGINNVEEYRS